MLKVDMYALVLIFRNGPMGNYIHISRFTLEFLGLGPPKNKKIRFDAVNMLKGGPV